VVLSPFLINRMNKYLNEAQNLFSYTRDLRRDFHQHPEIGFQEYRTSGIVARELTKLGLEVSTGIAETGVVAVLEGETPGPTLLVRFDMDALPIQEETGASYASQTPGVMHACGHDAHTAIGLTVARLLNQHRDELAGRVKLVFQPAEEGLGGAERMVAEGVLQNPQPDMALALHIWNTKPLGWVGITSGPVMAASERFSMEIRGSGGHAASPHETRDPILAAAHIITALQSIVSRNVSPLDAAVLSITQVHAGDAFNVIPSTARLDGTIRTFKSEVRTRVFARFHEISTQIAQAMGCTIELSPVGSITAVNNHPDITKRVFATAKQILPNSEIDTDYRTTGSEDMSYMMTDVPGCYFFVGSANEQLNAPHHHPRFDFDEDVLPRAAGLMAQAVADLLTKQ